MHDLKWVRAADARPDPGRDAGRRAGPHRGHRGQRSDRGHRVPAAPRLRDPPRRRVQGQRRLPARGARRRSDPADLGRDADPADPAQPARADPGAAPRPDLPGRPRAPARPARDRSRHHAGLSASRAVELHLVDATYELFRAHFAPRPAVLGRDGLVLSGVAGLVEQLLFLLREEGATHVGCATDRVIASFRNDLYPGYKTDAGMPPELLSSVPDRRTGDRGPRPGPLADGRVRGRRCDRRRRRPLRR